MTRPSVASGEIKKHKLASPMGETVAGILASVWFSDGAFKSLGLTQRNLDGARSLTFPIDSFHRDKAPRTILNANSCFTSVVLSHIRRIDHLEFERGDKIINFTFWQQQESNPRNTQRENAGRITGVRIDKTGTGRTGLEVCLGDKSDFLCYSFVENPFEQLEGLAWAFNHECDYVYVATKPSPDSKDTHLTLYNMIHLWPNSRMPGKLFWRVQDGEAQWQTVSQINVFFSNDDKKLSGFAFHYGQGQISRHVGRIEGVSASMCLEARERITRMDILTGPDEDEIMFYTSAGRVQALSAAGSYHQARHTEPSDFDVFEFDQHTECISALLSTNGPESSQPSSMAAYVGIWVTMKIWPRANNTVEAVGPIIATRHP
ncbi:hypothetical protein NW762_010483 [Fusarium torreyae]|uniref:Uncharacterized protein n=1 Tax=Fusarium torreyae TaxID=1237075 RepID=A0A9W8RV13_9HYPO|nr:hypothetical protein NW762_010483 [Fusarium torreyae]